MTTTPIDSLKCVDLSDVDIYAYAPVDDARYRVAIETYARNHGDNHIQVWFRSAGANAAWTPDYTCLQFGNDRSWNWKDYLFRVNPASRPKVFVPWNKIEDVTSEVRYVRNRGCKAWVLVLGVNQKGIGYLSCSVPCIGEWNSLGDLEWSSDLKTWHPCTKESSQ